MYKKYKYMLKNDYNYQLPINFNTTKELSELVKITQRGELIIKKGFLWDGCSPKFNIFDLFLIGTPDGLIRPEKGVPDTYYASLVHDVLCEFRHELPITRMQRAKIFYDLCNGFKLRKIYYWALILFGT